MSPKKKKVDAPHRIRVRVEIDGQLAFDIDEEVTTVEVNISSPAVELPLGSTGVLTPQWGPSGHRTITVSTYDAKRDALANFGRSSS